MKLRSIGLLIAMAILFGSAAPANAAPVTINFTSTFNTYYSNFNSSPFGEVDPPYVYNFSAVFDSANLTVQTLDTEDTWLSSVDGQISPITPYNAPALAVAGGVQSQIMLFDSRPKPGLEAGREEGVNFFLRSFASGGDENSTASGFMNLQIYAAAPAALQSAPVDGAFLMAFLAVIQQSGEAFPIYTMNETINSATGASANEYYGGSAVISSISAGATEVPEPASFALFGAGLLGMIALRRRSASVRTVEAHARA